MMPGPGQYQMDHKSIKTASTQGMTLMKKSTPNILGTVLNPPSIPSHLSVFGYEENPSGQLVQ